MRLLIDDADIQVIKALYEYYPIDGVTTNPSILSKTQRKPYETLGELREFLGPESELHVQVISSKAEDMVAEAEMILRRVGDATYIKIPAVPEGIKAIKLLAERGCHTTATAVYTPMQAYMAAKSGASYVAPYVNRIDNLGGDGVETVCKIQEILKANELKTKVLAASFKNVRQVEELCKIGIGAATASPSVIEAFLDNASVREAVGRFNRDFEKLCGEGRTMLEAE